MPLKRDKPFKKKSRNRSRKSSNKSRKSRNRSKEKSKKTFKNLGYIPGRGNRPSTSNKPIIGDKIIIIIKPYNLNNKVSGIVKRVLTKSKFHSRGHKVMLEDGTVGRTLTIL